MGRAVSCQHLLSRGASIHTGKQAINGGCKERKIFLSFPPPLSGWSLAYISKESETLRSKDFLSPEGPWQHRCTKPLGLSEEVENQREGQLT